MLKLININRCLGDFSLKNISIGVSEGEYYILLGRSGAGKTQLLELIAGLEHPDSGKIIMDGTDITAHKIQDRKIGIVFQDYAVFPHMTVFGNISYPLRIKHTDKKTISDRVEHAAATMNISHLLERSTDKLSGGELQRVALARTLITSPRLLLLDEPLSSLDASLKDDLKRLLRNLNKKGQTIIHVTHDYADAVSLAKKVGVIHNGRIIQEGSVTEVFNNPINRFVARYAGIKNFFRADIKKDNGLIRGVTDNSVTFKLNGAKPGNDNLFLIKNDSIAIQIVKPVNDSLNSIKGKITELIPNEYGFEVTVDTGEFFYVNIPASDISTLGLHENKEVWVTFRPEDIVVLNGS